MLVPLIYNANPFAEPGSVTFTATPPSVTISTTAQGATVITATVQATITIVPPSE